MKYYIHKYLAPSIRAVTAIKEKCIYYGYNNNLMGRECVRSFYFTTEESENRKKNGEVQLARMFGSRQRKGKLQ